MSTIITYGTSEVIMSAALVLGCGRSGTNMVLEILRGNPYFNASEPPETKGLFRNEQRIPDRFLTKCDTCYFDIAQFTRFMARNQHAKAVFTVRDPRDMAMSKLRRGVPVDQGGDCTTLADDATPDGCVEDIYNAFNIIKMATMQLPPDRCIMVRMEDVIRNTEQIARDLCSFLGIEYHKAMPDFVPRMRVKAKQNRYKKVDPSQIAMYRNWKTAYDGWLEGRFDMEKIFAQLLQAVVHLGYER